MTSTLSRESSQTPSQRARSFFGRNSVPDAIEPFANGEDAEDKSRPTRWGMGILNDPVTIEVPGSVLLLTGDHNQPLGLRNAPARTSASSLPQSIIAVYNQHRSHRAKLAEGKKKTKDGAIILEPQPDDSHNDPLNWPTLKRDAALLSLGLYCMVGGGVTPILAAGFSNVASTYHVTTPKIALTTGLYMMGLGVGSVFTSPTAILYGKRPVYLVGALLFVCTSIWCAVSPTYNSLLVARIFQGMSVSPVECLPSATIAEIFFLHERAYRIGIYTLLLLGGKNLIPLVSAAIIQPLGWRWVFWILAMIVGFCWLLLFLFVPETFWDRTPVPRIRKNFQNPSRHSFFSLRKQPHIPEDHLNQTGLANSEEPVLVKTATSASAPQARRGSHFQRQSSSPERRLHVGFASDDNDGNQISDEKISEQESAKKPFPEDNPPPNTTDIERGRTDYVNPKDVQESSSGTPAGSKSPIDSPESEFYTNRLQQGPRLTFLQQLKPYNGRLHHDKWLRVAFRPFILYAYPAVLWSSIVYSCSIGWLIVLSESVAVIYRSRTTYGFSALSTGLIYISPFIGGIFGTAVAGKVSDIIVRAMARRNGGLYEPEFRLVMAAPIAVTTVIGLMGFGWSAQVHDKWIVPTFFFGVISFGCSLGSTTAITFCVDSYRQYAGEALVSLNFSKNIFHGLVFSLFFTKWLQTDGSKKVFIWVGVIQLILMTLTIPMYIFGKRARMWTVRKNFMENF